MSMRTTRGLIVLALLGATVGTAGPVGAAEAQTGSGSSLVTIVHGLRGILVDVSLDGKLLLPAFEPDRLTDPLEVPAGPHTVTLKAADAPAGDPPKLEQSVEVPAGESVSLVAHFGSGDDWALSAFVNDVAPVAAGQARVTFRNTAAVESIGVRVDGEQIASDITAGDESPQVLAPSSYSVAVDDGDSSDPLIPPSDVEVSDGSATFLYLVGKGSEVTWLSQRIEGLQARPNAVATGDSGLAAEDSVIGGWWIVVIVGALALAGAFEWLRRRRLAT